jgi:hypothetical protein
MIVRENILLCNSREFIKILYPHPSKTGLLETLHYCTMILEDGPAPLVDKEKNFKR